jgi:long-chain acyl-CoA synthetase
MVGDQRKYPIMLVVPDLEAVTAWAKHLNIPVDEGLLSHPEKTALLDREVMTTLRDLASYEMPKKLILIERDFSIEDGDLTPSLKVKRRVVEEKYRDLIEEVYRD